MKHTRQRLLVVLFTVCTMLFALSLNASAAKLNKKRATISVGSSVTLKVKGSTDLVTWSSSKPNVAAVSATGKVTGISGGTTTIKAVVGNQVLKCKVTVKSNFKLSTNKITLKKSKVVTVTMKVPVDLTYTIYSTSKKPVCKCTWSNVWDPTYKKTSLTISPRNPGTATVVISGTKDKKDIAIIKITVPGKK